MNIFIRTFIKELVPTGQQIGELVFIYVNYM